MLRSRFLWKLYAGYSAVILISSAFVGIIISHRVERDTLEEIRQSLQTQAIFLKEPAIRYLTNSHDSLLQEYIRTLGAKVRTRLTVIKADGVVIADSDENPSGMDKHSDRPEILAARSNGLGIATRFSNTLGMRMMYLSLSVRRDGQLIGYVRTALPLSEIDKRLNQLRATIALSAVLSAIIALLLGLFLTRHFVKPLVFMTTVADAMSRGDYNRRLPTARKDEIGKLSQALNRMAVSCSERTDMINADRNKLSTILSGMAEGVVAVNQEERVVHLNEAAGILLGTSPKESMDKPIWQVTRVWEVSEILGDALRDETNIQSNLQIITQTREQLIEMHASSLHDGQVKLVGAVAVLHDVTELHRLEMIRREFVANASHELKTPITAIRGLVETLIDDKELDSLKRERFLGKIKDQSMRLSSIVTDLLTLSRLESKSSELEGISVDLCEIVIASVKPFVSIGEERGIEVETKVPDSPIKITGDEEALCQVVSNLLDNALKYTSKDGSVRVSIERQGDDGVIEVKDTGIGIEPNNQDRIFERFYRVDKARSRKLGGTGLGLSIVKHIAIAHGGYVTVESISGMGSTFRVFLPLPSNDKRSTATE